MALNSLRDRDRGSSTPDAHSNTQGSTRRDFLKILGLGALAATTKTDTGIELFQQEQTRQRSLHARARHFPRLQTPEVASEQVVIMPGVPTFSQLREMRVFNHRSTFAPPNERAEPTGINWVTGREYDSVEYAITASSESLTDIGVRLAENPRTSPLLQQTEVRILCPASGVLLSPLEIAFQMAEKSSVTQRFHFTYTEIESDAYRAIDSYIRRMIWACNNTVDFRMSEEHHPELGLTSKKKSMQFTYITATGRRVTIAVDFELQMSSDHYFRAASAAQADIVLFHDVDRTSHVGDFPQTKSAGDVYTLLTDTPSSGFSDKPHFCIISQEQCSWHHNAPSYATEGVGRVVETVQGKPFGCGQNHLDHDNILAHPHLENATAHVVELDTELIAYLHSHENDEFLRIYTLLLTPDALSQAMMDDQDGNLRVMLRNFVTKIGRIRDARIKGIIRRVARQGIDHVGNDRPRRAFFQAVMQATQ